MDCNRARASVVKSPRLFGARLCTSSIITERKCLNIFFASTYDSMSISDSGVVSKILGGFLRCRARLCAGVSPVRVSTVISSPICSIGWVKLRSISWVNALSGEIYKVCKPVIGCSCKSTNVGKKPDKVLPAPVGAINKVDSCRVNAPSMCA